MEFLHFIYKSIILPYLFSTKFPNAPPQAKYLATPLSLILKVKIRFYYWTNANNEAFHDASDLITLNSQIVGEIYSKRETLQQPTNFGQMCKKVQIIVSEVVFVLQRRLLKSMQCHRRL